MPDPHKPDPSQDKLPLGGPADAGHASGGGASGGGGDSGGGDDAAPATLKAKVIAALKEVYDPEIPIDIYELGLIYEVNVDEAAGTVAIVMTLTTPNCPVAQDLPAEVRAAAEAVPEVTKATLELTFDPPWTPERMSEAAKVHLGFM